MTFKHCKNVAKTLTDRVNMTNNVFDDMRYNMKVKNQECARATNTKTGSLPLTILALVLEENDLLNFLRPLPFFLSILSIILLWKEC